MMRSLFAAISGLRAHQQLLDVTANNIANVNTVGFKSERVSFKDALSQLQQGAGAPTTAGLGGSNAKQVGLGVQVASIDNIMSPGAIQSTGSPYDLAIQGEGWFVLNDKLDNTGALVGNTFYTRSGNFTRDANGNLVTPDGYYLVSVDPAAGGDVTKAAGRRPVTIPSDATSVSIDQTGVVTVVGGAVPTPSKTIQLARFSNEAGLQRASGNRWAESPNSNPATGPTLNAPGSSGFGSLATGAIEMSNVDLAQEFTNMITAQRGFQANGRVITATDEVLQELVNLKR